MYVAGASAAWGPTSPALQAGRVISSTSQCEEQAQVPNTVTDSRPCLRPSFAHLLLLLDQAHDDACCHLMQTILTLPVGCEAPGPVGHTTAPMRDLGYGKNSNTLLQDLRRADDSSAAEAAVSLYCGSL